VSYYVITIDGRTVHDTRLDDIRVLNPRHAQEVNASDLLTFSLEPKHRFYGLPRKRKSTVCLFQDGSNQPLFRGQVLDDEMDMSRVKKIVCEGDLGFLNDSIQRPYQFDAENEPEGENTVRALFERFITSHNEQMNGDRKKFRVGLVDIETPYEGFWRADTTYLNTFETLKAKLWGSALGGFVWTSGTEHVRYINYTKEPGGINTQEIRFGENLLDLKRFVRGADVITALIPLGATIEDEEPELEEDWDFDVSGGGWQPDDLPDWEPDDYLTGEGGAPIV